MSNNNGELFSLFKNIFLDRRFEIAEIRMIYRLFDIKLLFIVVIDRNVNNVIYPVHNNDWTFPYFNILEVLLAIAR